MLAMRGRRVTVLATGDPMCFGIGATLAGRVAPEEMTIVPHVSAFALAAARLVWPLDRVTMLSVHGRPIEQLALHVAPGARLLILAHDGRTPPAVAAMARRARLRRKPHDRARAYGRRQEIAHDGACARVVGARCRTSMCSRSNASPGRTRVW